MFGFFFFFFSRFLASLKTVFIDKPENVLIILKLAKQVPTLKRLVLTKKIPSDQDAEIQSKAKDLNIEVMTFNQLRVNCRWKFSKIQSIFHWFLIGIGPIESESTSCKSNRSFSIVKKKKKNNSDILATKTGWFVRNLLHQRYNWFTERCDVNQQKHRLFVSISDGIFRKFIQIYSIVRHF